MRVLRSNELLDRAYAKDDLAALLEIERASGSAAWSRSQLVTMLRSDCATFRVVALRDEPETAIGFYVIQRLGVSLYLANVSVAPAWRRLGVASFALGGVVRCAEKFGCRRVLLDVQECNLGAQLLYRENGFRAVKILPAFYRDQDGYRMERVVESARSYSSRAG